MAYPTIRDECLNGDHDTCEHRSPPDPRRGAGFVCGGWFCICECHWEGRELNQPWIDEVRSNVLKLKEAFG